MGVNHAGYETPEFGVRGRKCKLFPTDFVMLQNFKHQLLAMKFNAEMQHFLARTRTKHRSECTKPRHFNSIFLGGGLSPIPDPFCGGKRYPLPTSQLHSHQAFWIRPYVPQNSIHIYVTAVCLSVTRRTILYQNDSRRRSVVEKLA